MLWFFFDAIGALESIGYMHVHFCHGRSGAGRRFCRLGRQQPAVVVTLALGELARIRFPGTDQSSVSASAIWQHLSCRDSIATTLGAIDETGYLFVSLGCDEL